MNELKTEKRTMVFYISPHEYSTVIAELYECFGDREIALCRELTKLNEEITLTTLESAANSEGTSAGTGAMFTYTLNIKSKKFHDPGCSGATSIKEENRDTFTGNRDELIASGYEPCGQCQP